MSGQVEFKIHYLWDWKQERQLVSKWVSCKFLINFITIVYIWLFWKSGYFFLTVLVIYYGSCK